MVGFTVVTSVEEGRMAAVERPRRLKRLLLPAAGRMPVLLILAVAPGRENLADEEPERPRALEPPLELKPPLIRDEPEAPGSDVPLVELEVGEMADVEPLPGPMGRLNRDRPGENGNLGVASCVAKVLLPTELCVVASTSLALNPGRRLLANEFPLEALVVVPAARVAVTVGVTSVRLTTMALD